MRIVPVCLIAIALAACSAGDDKALSDAENELTPTAGKELAPPDSAPSDQTSGTRPAESPATQTYVGVFAAGTECPTLTLDDGRVFSLSVDQDAYPEGTRLTIEGELADASFCMAGEGTIIPTRMAIEN